MIFLANSHYVAFLDEDNWYEPNHFWALMEQIESRGLDWAYSLRRIIGPDDKFVDNDDCESLGKWSNWEGSDQFVIDTSCFVLRRDIAMNHAATYHRRFRDELAPDTTLCRLLLQHYPNCDTSGLYTLNYRVGRSEMSVDAQYFKEGNRVMRQRHGDKLPWQRAPRAVNSPSAR